MLSKLAADEQNKPWIMTHRKRAIRRLFNHAQLSGSKEDWNAYRNAKKVAQYESRKADNIYVKNLINPEQLKDCFHIIAKGQYKDCNGVPALEVNGNVVTNLAKPEEFKYFSSVFATEDSHCPPSGWNLVWSKVLISNLTMN